MTPQRMRKLGWTLFGLAWVPFIGIFVGMIGLPDGSYSWAQLPKLTRGSLILTGVFFGTSMLMQIGAPIVSGMSNRAIRKTGRVAEATIINVADTGQTINENPVVYLRLEVHPPGEPAFEATTEVLISRLRVGELKAGQTVAVKFDPKSKRVALVDAEDVGLVMSEDETEEDW